MSATGRFTKIAWIRDPDVPAGQPALGRFDCPCGNQISDVEFGGPEQECDRCGRVWDGRGWLISEPARRRTGPKRAVTYNGKTYKVRKDKIEIPDLDAMTRHEALTWLIQETYPLGTNHRRPNPLAGYAGVINVRVRGVR